jgi:hypothetical protein
MPANKKPITFNVTAGGCFEETSHTISRKGYPVISRYGKSARINRVIWEECFGWIPAGMFVCHKCDNPKCINPEHLFLGTPQDNMTDMANKGRKRVPNRKLTNDLRALIINKKMNGVSYDQIARLTGLGKSTVWQFMKGKTYRQAPEARQGGTE